MFMWVCVSILTLLSKRTMPFRLIISANFSFVVQVLFLVQPKFLFSMCEIARTGKFAKSSLNEIFANLGLVLLILGQILFGILFFFTEHWDFSICTHGTTLLFRGIFSTLFFELRQSLRLHFVKDVTDQTFFRFPQEHSNYTFKLVNYHWVSFNATVSFSKHNFHFSPWFHSS